MSKLRLILLALAVIGAAALALLTEPPRRQTKPANEATTWLKTDGGSACRIPPIDVQPDEYMARKTFNWKEERA
jgi:hypothetical protein